MFSEKLSNVAGEWEKIQKIIPILKELDYTDMHLYYEDCDIWVLEWHDPNFDNARFHCLDFEEIELLTQAISSKEN